MTKLMSTFALAAGLFVGGSALAAGGPPVRPGAAKTGPASPPVAKPGATITNPGLITNKGPAAAPTKSPTPAPAPAKPPFDPVRDTPVNHLWGTAD